MNANEKTEYHFRFREVRGKNLRGGEKINHKTIVMLGFVLIALTAVTATAEAKTYYQFYGHDAVRYNNNEIASVLQPYVDCVEYDLKYDIGSGCGVRLHYTEEGRQSIAAGNQYLLNHMTNAVMTAPEWKHQRSYISVWTEIYMHARWGKPEVHIEYNYVDLQWWEQPYRYI